MLIINMVVNWHKLYSSDSQLFQILDYRVICQARERTPQSFRHLRMALCKSFYMKLVDQRAVPGDFRRAVGLPIKSGVDNDGKRRKRGIILLIKGHVFFRIPDSIAEHFVAPTHPPAYRLGVGIKNDFIRIETMAGIRSIRPINAITIKLTWPRIRKITVPNSVRIFQYRDSARFALALG